MNYIYYTHTYTDLFPVVLIPFALIVPYLNEKSVTSKCISHQTSKAMQILHPKTFFSSLKKKKKAVFTCVQNDWKNTRFT